MIAPRGNYDLCLLALALILAMVGAAWGQAAPPASPEQAKNYRQAVSLLDQAEAQLTDGNLAIALSMVKQCNAIFTLLQKECAAALAERQLTSQEAQQLAINQKLAAEAQAQADQLLTTAAAKKKEGQDLQARGQAQAGDAALREAGKGYLQSQKLSIKSAIYALRNQQIIFRFLAP
jgi:hypothetical protein